MRRVYAHASPAQITQWVVIKFGTFVYYYYYDYYCRSQWPHGLRVCGRSPAEIVGSNPTGGGGMDMSVVSVVCCQVEVSATS